MSLSDDYLVQNNHRLLEEMAERSGFSAYECGKALIYIRNAILNISQFGGEFTWPGLFAVRQVVLDCSNRLPGTTKNGQLISQRARFYPSRRLKWYMQGLPGYDRPVLRSPRVLVRGFARHMGKGTRDYYISVFRALGDIILEAFESSTTLLIVGLCRFETRPRQLRTKVTEIYPTRCIMVPFVKVTKLLTTYPKPNTIATSALRQLRKLPCKV